MRVLLITTTPNSVSSQLSQYSLIDLCIINCEKDSLVINQKMEATVTTFSPDIIITYRCPYILSKSIFNSPKYGSYNIHPSLLPLYAGLNPWEEIFANKETVNGVTLHRITKRVDQGEIIFQKKYNIGPTDNIMTARDKADMIAAELALKLLSLNFA